MPVTHKEFSVLADANHVIEAFGQPLPPPQFTLTASALNGVTIVPSGNITLDAGASQLFVVDADAGFEIRQILVDGVAIEL